MIMGRGGYEESRRLTHSDPLLNRIFDGRGIPGFNGEVAAVTFDGKGAADIIVSV